MRLCSKVECYVEGPYSSNIWEEARYGATLDKLRWNVHVDKDVPKGNDPCMYLNDANVNTKKYVLEVLIPLLLPENYAPLGSKKTEEVPLRLCWSGRAGSPTFKEEIEQKEGKELQIESGYIYAMARVAGFANAGNGKKGIYLTLLEQACG